MPARVSISPFQLPACPPASLLGLNKGLTLLNCPALAGGPVGCRRGVQGSGFLKMAANPTRAGSKKCEVDVNTLLQKLQLNDVEHDGVVLAKEERENLPKVKWLAVAKLLTVKQFSDQSLSSIMMTAWNPARRGYIQADSKEPIHGTSVMLGRMETNHGGWTMAVSGVCIDVGRIRWGQRLYRR